MGFFTNYTKNSFRISYKELDILEYVVSLVDETLPFPKPANEIMETLDINWAPEMIFAEDDTYGMWTYMHVNSIYIRPDENAPMAWRIEQNAKHLTEEEQKAVNVMKNKKCWSEIMLGNLDVNHETLTFIISILESNGHTVSTILHEMWHRNQFLSSPIKYFLSCIATNLVNYEWACKQPWSIEYDVRQKVDNDELHEKLQKIYSKFYHYVYLLNKEAKYPLSDEEKETLDKLESDDVIQTLYNFTK